MVLEILAEVRRLRSKTEIIIQIDIYKERLADTIDKRDLLGGYNDDNVDLLILSLIDKIEALLWVLELDLPSGDHIEQITSTAH